jgi:hypothetical protein
VTLEPHKITETREQKSLYPFLSLSLSLSLPPSLTHTHTLLSNNNLNNSIVSREQKERWRGTHHIFRFLGNHFERKIKLSEEEEEAAKEKMIVKREIDT